MKAIFSKPAEDQTLRITKIDRRVSVRVRQCADGVITNDVVVDGYTYTPHVSQSWIDENIFAICQRVGREIKAVHIGMGQFVNP